MSEDRPLVGVIMGSKSDWDTMSQAAGILSDFGIPHEAQVVSAHRTPAWMAEYATAAVSRGLEVIIAGAGGAAHLPGMVAAHPVLPPTAALRHEEMKCFTAAVTTSALSEDTENSCSAPWTRKER